MSVFDYTFKILMIGDASVGKTTLSEHYITGVFNPDVRLTVGVEFFIKTVKIYGKHVKLQLWDLGGEDRFRFLLPTYCLGCSGAIFMYDVTSRSSLQSNQAWTTIVKEKNGNIPILLVGNKVDLDSRVIPRDHGIQVARQNGMAGFVETSAKEGINVNEAFNTLTDLMVKRMLEQEKNESD